MSPTFTDPAVEPTAVMIAAALGPAVSAWDELASALAAAGAPIAWRYFADGGWLAKAAAGAKTVAWLSVDEGHARIGFTFAERHRAVLGSADTLPTWLRAQIAGTPLRGRILPVSLEIRNADDVAVAEAVLAVKRSVK